MGVEQERLGMIRRSHLPIKETFLMSTTPSVAWRLY